MIIVIQKLVKNGRIFKSIETIDIAYFEIDEVSFDYLFRNHFKTFLQCCKDRIKSHRYDLDGTFLLTLDEITSYKKVVSFGDIDINLKTDLSNKTNDEVFYLCGKPLAKIIFENGECKKYKLPKISKYKTKLTLLT